MTSKKKSRNKARRAGKSRKVRADEDGAVNGIDSEMQRLQISNNKRKNSKDDEGEDALLEAAINLAAAEREELEAAAKNDEVNNSEECHHGFIVSTPKNHVCAAFFESFANEYNARYESEHMYQLFQNTYEATKTKFAEVWNDSDTMQRVASHFILHGTNDILEGKHHAASRNAMCSNFFEQWAAAVVYLNKIQASCDWDKFDKFCHWPKLFELFMGDEHTLVSFFRKRTPCKCLDSKYKEVKSITKIGFCYNPKCSLPERKTARSKMLSCTQCRKANYCSSECQAADWPFHKGFCRLVARESRQKK